MRHVLGNTKPSNSLRAVRMVPAARTPTLASAVSTRAAHRVQFGAVALHGELDSIVAFEAHPRFGVRRKLSAGLRHCCASRGQIGMQARRGGRHHGDAEQSWILRRRHHHRAARCDIRFGKL